MRVEIELWWLLAVPLFFVFGWLAARWERRQANSQSRALPEAYFSGLNHLLNDRSDRAIDSFTEVVRIAPELAETHFALGNLFRRRGETERAIRVHQNLAARDDVPPAQREQAIFALGEDYMKAGLLDRAEAAFNQLSGTGHADAALAHRLTIAQAVRDWPAAIELAQSAPSTGSRDTTRLIGHFHCELAQAALGNEDAERAGAEISAALKVSPDQPRPWLLAAQLAMLRSDPTGAIDAWRKAAEISPLHIGLAAGSVLDAFDRLGRADEGLTWLEQLHEQRQSVELASAITQARSRRDGAASGLAWAEAQLTRYPSLAGLDQLLEARLSESVDLSSERRAELETTRKLIHGHARRLSRYFCNHCGFKARQFYWQCPGCMQWDSYLPRRSEEAAVR